MLSACTGSGQRAHAACSACQKNSRCHRNCAPSITTIPRSQGAAPSSSAQPNGFAAPQQPGGGGGGGMHRVGVADTEITPAMSTQLDRDTEDGKYARRQTGVRRTLQRVFPGLFQQGSLPVTTK